jgi:hypothetical protein
MAGGEFHFIILASFPQDKDKRPVDNNKTPISNPDISLYDMSLLLVLNKFSKILASNV